MDFDDEFLEDLRADCRPELRESVMSRSEPDPKVLELVNTITWREIHRQRREREELGDKYDPTPRLLGCASSRSEPDPKVLELVNTITWREIHRRRRERQERRQRREECEKREQAEAGK
jgi:hypothetical protein